MNGRSSLADRFPRWFLAIGPLVILLATLALLYLTSPFGHIDSMTDASTVEILWMLTIIGAIAGIAPVVIGMLWFPFIRSLDYRFTQAFLAVSAGVLAFIAFEIAHEIVELSTGATTATTLLVAIVVFGFGVSFGVMYIADKWQKRIVCDTTKTGLSVGYLVAIALGLHSLGEGLAIGTAFAQSQGTLLMLLVIGFVIHNVMEGPTVVAAVATDAKTPPFRHFVAMGLIVGIPCVIGGWIGGFVSSTVFAVLFFAIALGAILPAILQVSKLLQIKSATVATRLNVAMFGVGLFVMFFLEDILVHGILLSG